MQQQKAAAEQQKPKGKPRGRPFAKGQSGNPRGKLKGTMNLVTREAREVAESLIANPLYIANLRERLEHGKIAPAVEAMLWGYSFGRPREQLDVSATVTHKTEYDDLSTAEIRARLRAALERLGDR